MKTVIISAALATAALVWLLCTAGCSTGGHSVCYDGKCVHWTNAPASTNR